jgi:hypothetical protein
LRQGDPALGERGSNRLERQLPGCGYGEPNMPLG